jgi:hypothetical protein
MNSTRWCSVEQRAPNGFDNIEPAVSAQDLAEGISALGVV